MYSCSTSPVFLLYLSCFPALPLLYPCSTSSVSLIYLSCILALPLLYSCSTSPVSLLYPSGNPALPLQCPCSIFPLSQSYIRCIPALTILCPQTDGQPGPLSPALPILLFLHLRSAALLERSCIYLSLHQVVLVLLSLNSQEDLYHPN